MTRGLLVNRRAAVDLDELLRMFPVADGGLARFTAMGQFELPPVYRELLAHDRHMTETVETFHGASVDVEVLAREMEGSIYARKILLRRRTDRVVVLLAIVRLGLHYLSDDVRNDIIGERIPLGRTLVEHGVMRDVMLVGLWHVTCGLELARYFSIEPGSVTYGRTALIYCDGEPAIELLEIVPPVAAMAI